MGAGEAGSGQGCGSSRNGSTDACREQRSTSERARGLVGVGRSGEFPRRFGGARPELGGLGAQSGVLLLELGQSLGDLLEIHLAPSGGVSEMSPHEQIIDLPAAR